MTLAASRTSFYLEIIKGERTGLAAGLIRAGLAVPEYLLWLPASTAAKYYRLHGPNRPYRAPCPVISVGNITAGGTGKTPMVEWLVRWLKANHRRPAVLSRGYRATSRTSNDESLLLSSHLGDVPVLTGKDRARSARVALAQKLANVFVLDDGFQHWPMARDLDIVLIDSLLPFGGGHLLPRGLLREPVTALKRAGIVVITRTDLVSDERRCEIRDAVASLNGSVPIVESAHVPVGLVAAEAAQQTPEPLEISSLPGKGVLLFSGIGNPEGFEKTVASLGCTIAESFRFRDHHRYFDHELTELQKRAERVGCDVVLTTEKDIVKIGRCWNGRVPLIALKVEIRITAGEDALAELLLKTINH
ncbi:MAG TPA: tetraacyldisaccharide 4'-kinase [Planctomycetota bacterium]|nr:tetraacyldisaccharide 4'-kinase [Planctomycetota bacterium]